MKEIIATGKNIEKAIEKGLEELGVKFEDVDIEVISEGGFFSKAKVKITVNEKEELPPEPVVKTEKVEIDGDGISISLKKETVETKTQEVNELIKEEVVEITLEEKQEKTQKSRTNDKKAMDYLNELFALSEQNCTTSEKIDNNFVKITIEGENLSNIIGNKGECLTSLQYILNLIKCEEEKGKKIILDAGDYKKNREEKLKIIAEKLIEKVKTTGRWEKMKPMSAYERRVVHEVVSNSEGVRSESHGEEPNRYLTIFPDNNN